MPKVTYIDASGTSTTVDVPVGHSIMEGAINNGVNGIDADCGGYCSCATCHVFVDDAWLSKLPEVGGEESGMLDCTAVPRAANSRLGCQVPVTEAMDGLTVRLPERQS